MEKADSWRQDNAEHPKILTRHCMVYAGPVLATVSLQPYTNSSAKKGGRKKLASLEVRHLELVGFFWGGGEVYVSAAVVMDTGTYEEDSVNRVSWRLASLLRCNQRSSLYLAWILLGACSPTSVLKKRHLFHVQCFKTKQCHTFYRHLFSG